MRRVSVHIATLSQNKPLIDSNKQSRKSSDRGRLFLYFVFIAGIIVIAGNSIRPIFAFDMSF